MSKRIIIYEQPLNELVRASLRIEHLFNQIEIYRHLPDSENHIQTLVKLIIDLLNSLDRPDLKPKLMKEFNRFISIFSKLQKTPNISHETLQKILYQLNDLIEHFLITPGKVGQSLRDSEFLANMRQNLLSAGGDSHMDAPYYHYWLNQSVKSQHKQIETWLLHFEKIHAATNLLLSIVRDSAESIKLIAEKGFYYESLDPQASIQLIRVGLESNKELYPEISAGRHRISIRFVIPNLNARPRQATEDVKFQLTKCII